MKTLSKIGYFKWLLHQYGYNEIKFTQVKEYAKKEFDVVIVHGFGANIYDFSCGEKIGMYFELEYLNETALPVEWRIFNEDYI